MNKKKLLAKPYQVNQLLKLVELYDLELGE
jgi:hypothetical protein